MAKRLKRPRDPLSLAKLIGDIATGQVQDAQPDDGKNPAAEYHDWHAAGHSSLTGFPRRLSSESRQN
jgi:hypothetical protein